jgi:hypothetical protein
MPIARLPTLRLPSPLGLALSLSLSLSLSLAVSTPACAHAVVKSSSPAASATVSPGPTEIRVTFNEPLESTFCTVRLAAADGLPVAAAPLKGADGDPTTLVLPLAAAPAAGTYRVRWSAMGRDGHRTKGDFGFTVK